MEYSYSIYDNGVCKFCLGSGWQESMLCQFCKGSGGSARYDVWCGNLPTYTSTNVFDNGFSAFEHAVVEAYNKEEIVNDPVNERATTKRKLSNYAQGLYEKRMARQAFWDAVVDAGFYFGKGLLGALFVALLTWAGLSWFGRPQYPKFLVPVNPRHDLETYDDHGRPVRIRYDENWTYQGTEKR